MGFQYILSLRGDLQTSIYLGVSLYIYKLQDAKSLERLGFKRPIRGGVFHISPDVRL